MTRKIDRLVTPLPPLDAAGVAPATETKLWGVYDRCPLCQRLASSPPPGAAPSAHVAEFDCSCGVHHVVDLPCPSAPSEREEIVGALKLDGFTRRAEEDPSTHVCRECGNDYVLVDGCDPSPECDRCAHVVLARARASALSTPSPGTKTCGQCAFRDAGSWQCTRLQIVTSADREACEDFTPSTKGET